MCDRELVPGGHLQDYKEELLHGEEVNVPWEPPEGTPRVTDMSWGTRCGTGLPARNSPMVGTSVPVPGILSHDISFHTHLPGLSIVLGFNLQHRMGRWSQEGSVRHVGGSLWHPRLCLTSGSPLDSKFLVSYVSHTWNPRRPQRWMPGELPQGCTRKEKTKG